MAKEENDTVPGTIGVGKVKGGGDQVKAVPNPIKPKAIEDEKTAREFVKARYKVPKEDKKTYVTSDCNVFYEASEGSAKTHARKNNLKLFEITWD
jgi:hypothetical protein